ncbi:MAG TPA: TraB/GumN family protein, partial [Chitinispirillaceae bacterium]|nr:TraB/GumN family protein [Chitinispirillaceae bacterium]
ITTGSEPLSAIPAFTTEGDTINDKDPSTQQKLMTEGMYIDGSTIDKHLSPQTYKLLSEYCAFNDIPLPALMKLKPSMIGVMITAMELAKFGVLQEGVDTFFYESAKRDGKIVERLETVEEQIHFITAMGKGNEDSFVSQTIKDLKSIKQQYESLVNSWKKGDTRQLNNLMVTDLKKNPRLYKELLTDRNQKWLPMIEDYQKTPEKEFILVGVGHLVGPDGIIQALRQKGYKVEKLRDGKR